MTELSTRRYGGRPVEEWKAARRERLLEAGLDLFGSEGYQATSIERLCATARVSTRHFYQEFPNKEAVLIDVHGRGVERGVERTSVALAQAPPSPIQDRLAHGLRAYLHTVMDDPRLARVSFVEVVGVSDAVERRRLEFRELITEVIVVEGRAAVERGEIEDRDFRFFGMALIGAVNAVVYDWMLRDPRPPAEDVQTALVELAITLLGAKERPVP